MPNVTTISAELVTDGDIVRDFAAQDEDIAVEAQRVLGEGDVEMAEFAHGQRIGVTAEVARVYGDRGSAVVKVIAPWRDGDAWRGSHDSASYRYWRREADIYWAGLPAAYTEAGVVQPHLYGMFERADGRVSLWLREVRGASGQQWSVQRTVVHARRLGRAQGCCAIDASWTRDGIPWSRGMLREYLDTPDATSADIDWSLLHDPELWDTPLMRHHFGALRDDLLRLCDDRYEFVDLGERLPQTLCHHDAWPKNFFDDGEATVGVDWAFTGFGWVGADIGNYVSDTALDLLRPADQLPALERAVFDGYCQGLREAGWDGDSADGAAGHVPDGGQVDLADTRDAQASHLRRRAHGLWQPARRRRPAVPGAGRRVPDARVLGQGSRRPSQAAVRTPSKPHYSRSSSLPGSHGHTEPRNSPVATATGASASANTASSTRSTKPTRF